MATNVPLTLFSAALFIYAVPTLLEFLAAHYFNPWLASILIGDFIGCAWLGGILKMHKTALLLYLLLASCKSILYVFQAIPVTTLFWITDVIPAVLIAGVIARPNFTSAAKPAAR